MKAMIPDDMQDKIYKVVLTEILVDVLNKKVQLAESEGKEGYRDYLNKGLQVAINNHRELKTYMHENQIKVHPVKVIDEMIVKYPYSIKMETGYKEGYIQFWKAAIKLHLKRMTKEIFGKEV